jgi:hypothetical protein
MKLREWDRDKNMYKDVSYQTREMKAKWYCPKARACTFLLNVGNVYHITG